MNGGSGKNRTGNVVCAQTAGGCATCVCVVAVTCTDWWLVLLVGYGWVMG